MAQFGENAQCYESERAIEEEFIVSWTFMDAFYKGRKPEAVALVHALQERGYNRTLRAGQSVWRLILSRSRRHGLRLDQPYIAIDLEDGLMTITSHADGIERRLTTEPRVTQELTALLDELVARPID